MRLRVRMERRVVTEVEVEIPAGLEVFHVKGMLIVNAGKFGFMSAQDAAGKGLLRILEPAT